MSANLTEEADPYFSALLDMLPRTWTHIYNVDLLQIGFAAKLAGLDWKSLPELFTALEISRLIQRDGYTIRRAQ